MAERKYSIECSDSRKTFERLEKLLKEGQNSQFFATNEFVKKLKTCKGVKQPKHGGLPPYGEIDIEWFEYTDGKRQWRAAFVFFCEGEQGGYHRLVDFRGDAFAYHASMSRMDNVVKIHLTE